MRKTDFAASFKDVSSKLNRTRGAILFCEFMLYTLNYRKGLDAQQRQLIFDEIETKDY